MKDSTKVFLSQAEYLNLPIEKRNKLRELFNISKSGQIKVTTTLSGNDRLISDGTEPEDLLNSLNKEKIGKFLGKENVSMIDFDVLFEELLNVVFKIPKEKEEMIKEKKIETETPENSDVLSNENIPIKKRGRPKKV